MKKWSQRGSILPTLIVFMAIVGVVSVAAGGAIVVTMQAAANATTSTNAFQIAEAGVNYYLWHLNHNNADYTDGVPVASAPQDATLGYGPFTHDYIDMNGNKLGTFTLYIKQVSVGSTIVKVRSIGRTTSSSMTTRTVEAQIGAPSFSTYAIAGNSALWFGNTETATGPVMSNVGIKMDGTSTDTVSSARSTYTVPSWSGTGSGTTKPGVWCDASVTTPVNCNTRNKSNWIYPVPAVDFNALTADMCSLKKLATGLTVCNTVPGTRTAGYIPPVNSSSFSTNVGYLVSLNDNGTYTLERVTAENDTKTSYSLALTRTTVQANITIPANGVIFVEDNVWLRTSGSVGFPGRVTIVSARLAVTGDTTMTIADDVLYKDKYNSTAVIGGIAENNVEIAPYVGAPAEVDGSYIAKSGGVGIRQKYKGTSTYVPGYALSTQAFTFFGSLASNAQWTWSVTLCGTETNASCWAGYRYTNTIYDTKLRYSPPPSFPVTSTFDILSWREVMTSP